MVPTYPTLSALHLGLSYEFEHAYATHPKLGQPLQRRKVKLHIRVNTHFGMAPIDIAITLVVLPTPMGPINEPDL